LGAGPPPGQKLFPRGGGGPFFGGGGPGGGPRGGPGGALPRGGRARPAYFFSTFQKVSTGPGTKPLMLLRRA
jgi:hypothetical protein